MAVAKKGAKRAPKVNKYQPSFTMKDSHGSKVEWCDKCNTYHKLSGSCNAAGLATVTAYLKKIAEENKRMADDNAKLLSLKPLIECFGLEVEIFDSDDYATIYVKKDK